MLKALTIAEALAIADASLRRSRDERAMVEYLGIGRRRARAPRDPGSFSLLKPTAVDLAAFESEERRELRDALASLTAEARRELVALVWFAQSPAQSFEAALRRTRRIPVEAQVGYLLGKRLERYVAAGLEKLGYRLGGSGSA